MRLKWQHVLYAALGVEVCAGSKQLWVSDDDDDDDDDDNNNNIKAQMR